RGGFGRDGGAARVGPGARIHDGPRRGPRLHAGHRLAGGHRHGDVERVRALSEPGVLSHVVVTQGVLMPGGLDMVATEYAIHVGELAREAEQRGFESLFLPEHTHIPKSRRSPWPGGPNLPKEYWHTHDPFVALAIAASATTRIKLGTGVCLIVERDT